MAGDFLESGSCRSQAWRGGGGGWGGVGMRGRAFPEDRPFPNNTKKGEGRGPTSLSGGKEALSQHRAGLPLPIRRRRGQGLSRSADVNTRGRPSGPPFLRRSGGHAPPEQGGGVGGRLPAPAILPAGAVSLPQAVHSGGQGGGRTRRSECGLPPRASRSDSGAKRVSLRTLSPPPCPGG